MTVGSPDMISSFPEEKGVFFLNFFFLTSSTLISHTGVRKTRRCIFFFFFKAGRAASKNKAVLLERNNESWIDTIILCHLETPSLSPPDHKNLRICLMPIL